MDACSDPKVEQVVWMKSSQVGATSIIENIIGYYIDQDPSPILVVAPTLEKAEEFSKERLSPMLRDTPCLRGKVRDARTRDSGNTLLSKVFPGGHLAIAGANSPAGLASRPRRVLICDEVDRYEVSAGTEGDPIKIAFKRTTTFRRRKKILLFSSPATTGRIELAYSGDPENQGESPGSDQRRYFVPCPDCGYMQTLKWAHVRWKKKLENGDEVIEPPKDYRGKLDELPYTAAYYCAECGAEWAENERLAAVRAGEWRAEKPFRGIAGFHINEIYSPWVTLAEMARAFLEAKKHPELLKVFINTSLAETWREEDKAERVEWKPIRDRVALAEEYQLGDVPAGVLMLFAGVDTQNDRFAPIVYGFGRGEECWLVYWGEIYGDPIYDETRAQLDALLAKTWKHPFGGDLQILGAAIDSGGGRTHAVYNHVRQRGPKVFAIKGQSQPGLPIIAGRPTLQDVSFGGRYIKQGVHLWPVGSDTAKAEIYARLRLEAGPRTMHFPVGLADEFYEQLTSEKLITKYRKGVPYQEWFLPSGARNEVLDSTAYCFAAAIRGGLQRANWDQIEKSLRRSPGDLGGPGPDGPSGPIVRSRWLGKNVG